MRDQKMSLRLIADRGLLIVRRRSKGGWGKKERWEVGLKSFVPRALYFMIHNYVQQRIKRCDNAKDSVALRKSVLRGLREAAEACRCEPEFGREGADVVWYLGAVPLIGFHVANDKCKKKAVERLLAGNPVFRWTIAVAQSGWFHIQPRETHPKFRHEKPAKANWLRQGRGV
jgi:hypothetical protein